ncbi:hypothetical protein Syun_031061 [Stephania yunnanensis]|uniref:Uncharacterized protein n=1 Tax=Stephania yunnanensis TaxID=152371 RepID=A0AAP0DYL9_9MAGN
MLVRLKSCYLCSYHSNPQLELCKDSDSIFIVMICLVSLIVLVQAAFRSFTHKGLMFSCNGSSDYEWSVWIILGTQIATILIGSIGAWFRLITLMPHMKDDGLGLTWAYKGTEVIYENPLLNFISIKDGMLEVSIMLIYLVILLLTIVPYATVNWIRKRCFCILSKRKERNIDEIREFLHLIHETGQGLEEWTLQKGIRDMKQWMEPKRNSAAILSIEQFLSKACALPVPLIDQLKVFANGKKAYEVSSLSLVLITRIATVCVPDGGSLISKMVREIFDVIHFVEKKMSSTSFENNKSKLAKAAFEGPSSRDELLKVFKISDTEASQWNNDMDRVINAFGKLRDALPSDPVKEELCIITDFIIKHQNCISIEELDNFITQLFVEMLNEFLVRLPNAIDKEITESSPEDYEKVIRFSLKLLCKVESLKDCGYPIGTAIGTLITGSSNGE